MNPDFPTRLAAQLRANPSLFEEMDDSLLGELVFHYAEGELDADDAAEVAVLLQTDPKAKAIYQRIEAADRFTASPAGNAWLENLRAHMLPPCMAASVPADKAAEASIKATTHETLAAILASLRDAISELFVSRASLATASGREGMKRTTKDGETRILLKPDSAGRQWLYVTSTKREFAGRSFQVEVEPTQALLSFSEATPGVYDAHACISDELAAALSSGAELKLIPVPLS